ncbi:MAG: hypothetical protein EBQ95_02230 [Gammaproteobacteria bacterium]|nr:hypothetical protein [Gammaproteobacteria bacterium]
MPIHIIPGPCNQMSHLHFGKILTHQIELSIGLPKCGDSSMGCFSPKYIVNIQYQYKISLPSSDDNEIPE